MTHGTLHGYTRQRCRCDLCRAANRAYRRQYRKTNLLRDPRTGRTYPPLVLTPALRLIVKQQVSTERLRIAAVWVAEHGIPNCDHCGIDIADAKPGKRFCSTRCQKAHSQLTRKYREVAA